MYSGIHKLPCSSSCLSSSSKATFGDASGELPLPILLISAGVVQSITFSLFGDGSCQTKCASNTEACQVGMESFWRRSENQLWAALVLDLFSMGISIIFYPKRTTPLVRFLTDDVVAAWCSGKNNTQNLAASEKPVRRKEEDIEMAQQEQLDETENEAEPEASDWIPRGSGLRTSWQHLLSLLRRRRQDKAFGQSLVTMVVSRRYCTDRQPR
jgi:hypothetical protein